MNLGNVRSKKSVIVSDNKKWCLVRMYSYGELGKKLRSLRTSNDKKSKMKFSLSEL